MLPALPPIAMVDDRYNICLSVQVEDSDSYQCPFEDSLCQGSEPVGFALLDYIYGAALSKPGLPGLTMHCSHTAGGKVSGN